MIDFSSEFSNLRDLGSLVNDEGFKILPNKVLRSNQLVDSSESKLKNLISKEHIKSIIDLRTPIEIGRYRQYPNLKKMGVHYYNFPMECEDIPINSTIKQHRHYDGYEYLYYHLLRNEGAHFKRCLKIISNAKYQAIIYHCIAGKDRTGILTALLLLTLNIPKNVIVRDFMKTPNADNKNIKHFFNLIEEYGGIGGYLSYIRIDKETVQQLRRGLLEPIND